MEKLERIRELNEWYAEFDKRFPAWYRKLREKARRIYEDYERKGYPICKYGVDFDFSDYIPNVPPTKPSLKDLFELKGVEREYVQTVGIELSEKERAGSHLQEDTSVVYNSLSKRYGKGVIAMNPQLAIFRYPFLKRYYHRLIPIGLDKYTALCAAYSIGGCFLWIKRGMKVSIPIQACFWIETQRIAQLPYILIIAEPYSEVNIISGCVMHPRCTSAVHGCITEIYVKRGAKVTFNIIHNFKPGFHIRPKVGVLLERDACYAENYIEIGEPTSAQLYPTAILKGENAKADMRSFFFARGKANMDIGAAIIFNARQSKGEIKTRAVVCDRATVAMRGALKARVEQARGHLECRALLLSDKASANAYPNLSSSSSKAMLTHEAAVGRISEEELCYLMSRGFDEEEATSLIVRGFLDIAAQVPASLQSWLRQLISSTAKQVM